MEEVERKEKVLCSQRNEEFKNLETQNNCSNNLLAEGRKNKDLVEERRSVWRERAAR